MIALTLRDAEREWLGLETPGLTRRMAETGWAPDPLDAYCPRCAAGVGPHETGDDGCSACRGSRPHWQHALRLGSYDSELGLMVREIKFTRSRNLGTRLGRLLGERIATDLSNADIEPSDAAIVPVPMSRTRYMQRGIDHTLVLARGASRTSRVPILRALRRAHGAAQLEVAPSARQANVRGVFRPARSSRRLAPRVAILLDDVRTTGATLSACARVLKRAGTGRIWAAVLAVTPERGARAAGPA